MPLQPIQTLWLDAIAANHKLIGSYAAREVWNRTILQTEDGLPRLYTVSAADSQIIRIPPVATLPPIESREMMLYILARRMVDLRVGNRPLIELCQSFGCWGENERTISERWRLLHMTARAEYMPYANLETRPACKICSGRVATGAGWNPESAGLDPKVFGVYRTDVHHECKNYALTVLMPRYRAQQAEAAKAATKEADK